MDTDSLVKQLHDKGMSVEDIIEFVNRIAGKSTLPSFDEAISNLISEELREEFHARSMAECAKILALEGWGI
ncbi:MAG TPA: hypothetical protein PKD85_15640 [Saprospiraceae bacterium]|mgnify:CR=1 FL=1|nr:hypothetical protein [Saprospiraceae bacterium]